MGTYFRRNGTYDANGRLILSSLPSKVTAQEGFLFNGSSGQETKLIYSIRMCLTGSTSKECSDCIKIGFDGLIQSFTNQTEAYSWPGDPTFCLVHYSNASLLGSADLAPSILATKAYIRLMLQP